MKIIGVLFVMCGLTNAVSELPTLQKGTTELNLVSDSSKKNAFVAYKLCMNSVPFFVNATVRTQDPNLPHEFKLTILEIFSHGFIVGLERIDQSSDWQEDLFVDWLFYIGGNGILLNGQYLWMPDPSTTQTQTQAQAKASCATLGASLLDIIDKTTYDRVYDYISSTYQSGNLATIWLAMTFNQTSMTPISSSGLPAYSREWYHGYPIDKLSHTGMLLQVKNFHSAWIGLWNHPPTKPVLAYNFCVKSL